MRSTIRGELRIYLGSACCAGGVPAENPVLGEAVVRADRERQAAGSAFAGEGSAGR